LPALQGVVETNDRCIICKLVLYAKWTFNVVINNIVYLGQLIQCIYVCLY
jgi:hypothetical protein